MKRILITMFSVMFVLSLWQAYVFLQIDACLDDRGVWDYEIGKCRRDCLKWGKDFGCIKLTAEEIETVQNCSFSGNCLTDKMYREICLRNQKAYQPENNICKFDFKRDDCGRLEGDWTYPDICKMQ